MIPYANFFFGGKLVANPSSQLGPSGKPPPLRLGTSMMELRSLPAWSRAPKTKLRAHATSSWEGTCQLTDARALGEASCNHQGPLTPDHSKHERAASPGALLPRRQPINPCHTLESQSL
mmetsp:Transcript_79616/g.191037  ORF Transcript_79616/g.191037 Transcript_79616/m.191037 type:complete len:119 (-) Transcript_79616:1126-1482(-)